MHIKHRDFSRLTKIGLIYIRIKWIQSNTIASNFFKQYLVYHMM